MPCICLLCCPCIDGGFDPPLNGHWAVDLPDKLSPTVGGGGGCSVYPLPRVRGKPA